MLNLRMSRTPPPSAAALLERPPAGPVPPSNQVAADRAGAAAASAARVRSQWLWLLLVLALALVLRLAVVGWLAGMPLFVADERDYDALATHLAATGQYAYQPGVPTSLRPPLYPALVAGVYRLAGPQSHTLVRLVQALLGTLTVALVWQLGRRLYDERTGLVAAAIVAAYPSLVAATGLILTETLFTFLLVAGVTLLVEYRLRGGWGWVAAGSAMLALAALTRSVLWLFPPILLSWVLLAGPGTRWTARLGHAGVAAAAFGLVLLPWTIRNTLLHKTFVTVDVMGGRNFMMGNYEFTPLDRPWDAISMEGERAWHHVLLAAYPDRPPLTQGQLDKLALKYGLNYVRRHPVQTLVRDVAKFFHFWQLEREVVAGLARGWWGELPRWAVMAVAAVIVSSYVVVLLSGVWGALRAMSGCPAGVVLLVLVIALVCGIHTLVFGHSRYHLPLMPLVGVFAAAAMCQGRDLLTRQRGKLSLWFAAGLCGLLVAGWAVELLSAAARLWS
jgi:4-amino-4-deoxy-L-arabinose transferase-like glycosyltransferase